MAAERSSACPTIPATASVWIGCTAKMSAASIPSACCRSLGTSPGLPPALTVLLESWPACQLLLNPPFHALSHCSQSTCLVPPGDLYCVTSHVSLALVSGGCPESAQHQMQGSPFCVGEVQMDLQPKILLRQASPRRCGGSLCQPLLSLLPEDTSSEVPWPGRRCLRPSEPPLHRLSPFLCSGISRTERLASHAQNCHP